jgi:hypothetical protein
MWDYDDVLLKIFYEEVILELKCPQVKDSFSQSLARKEPCKSCNPVQTVSN